MGHPAEVEKQVSECDVILAVYDPRDYNNRNGLPNKLFLAMKLGKPIIVASGSRAQVVVSRFNMGLSAPYDTTEVRVLIKWLSGRPDMLEVLSKGARKAYSFYNWERESKRLVKAY